MSSAVRRMMTICHQCQNSTEISLNQEESVTLSPQMVRRARNKAESRPSNLELEIVCGLLA
jgi:hypothetical protein